MADEAALIQALMSRGLRAYGGNMRSMDFQKAPDPAQSVVGGADVANGGAASALAARNGVGGGGSGLVATTPDPTTLDEATQRVMQGTPSIGSEFDPLALLGGAGATGAAGYGLYRALKGRKGSKTINSADFGGNNRLPNNSDGIIDAEWSEVAGGAGQKQLSNQMGKPNPVDSATEAAWRASKKKQAGYADASADAARTDAYKSSRAKSDRFMQKKTPPVMNKPPATVKEPLEAGLARTLGKESEIVRMFKANPGLARTLAKVLP